MTFVPRRIHKDKPTAKRLDNLDPNSILGQWDWELRGDYYYPVAKADPVDTDLVNEFRLRRGMPPLPVNRVGSLIKVLVPLAIMLIAAVVSWLG